MHLCAVDVLHNGHRRVEQERVVDAPLAGVRRLPEGRRRPMLATKIDAALDPYRETSAILPFDGGAAEQYADVLAAGERTGLPISTAEAQIAAICRAHGAVCATCNSEDFADAGVELVDPWSA